VIAASFAKIAAASLVLSIVCYASYRFLFDRYGAAGFSLRAVEAFLPIMLGGAAFLVAAKLLRISELEQLIAMFKRKFGGARA